MYESFFGMQRRPFAATPDPGCFFSCESVQAALDELIVCSERGQGIGILSAPAGMGKTLLCQRLVGETAQRFEVVYLGNANFPTRRSLLQAILFEMGDEYSRKDEPELRLDLRSRLLSIRPAKEALILIIDEAHLFADELLEEIRTLSDIAHDGSPLVRVILSAQPELEERLTSRNFDAFNQRISNQVYLESLTLSESRDYLTHRLAWSGSSLDDVFQTESVDVITRASDGVPRCLNQLADHSLLLAFASDEQPVARQTVCEALDDLKQLPLHWNDVSTGETVVGWQDDDEDEENPQMPETDIVTSDLTDAPPRVAIEFGGPERQADGASDPVGVTSAHDIGDSDGDVLDEESWSPIAPSAPAAAVIEFGEPLVSDTTDDDVMSEAAPSPEAITAKQLEFDSESPKEPELAEASDDDSCDDIEDEDTYADLQGLCFEITARGCQFEAETSPVDDSDSVEDSVMRLLDESSALSSELAVENNAQVEPEYAESVADAVAPTTSITAIAEDSDDEGVCSDVGGEGAAETAESPDGGDVASLDLDFETDASGGDTVEVTDPVASETTHVLDIDHTGESAVSDGLMTDPLAVVDEDHDADEFEEEVVIDHYSAIAEPQSTGIIWNLVGSRRHEVAPVSAEHDQASADASILEAEQDAPEQTSAVAPELAARIEESVDEPCELSVGEVEQPEDESLAAPDAASEIDSPASVLEFGAPTDASKEVTGEYKDDVMAVQPDSRIDAIVPLLQELSGGNSHSEQPPARDRSMLDIEAELVQTVSHGQPEIEDEIGAAILDMCLDTQAQIQQASQSIEDEAPADDGIDAAMVDDMLDDALEADSDHDLFDIVQPEEPRAAAFRFDSAPLGVKDPDSPVEARSDSPQPRPFGRLFSELRRRQCRVG